MFAPPSGTMKRPIPFYFILLIYPALSLLFSACANIIPPGGGPRDSLPPKLVMANPKDSATNVRVKNMILTFDEFVTVQNQLENIIVSPVVKNPPSIDYKLRTVSIRFKDSLEANTTYSINFGNAIQDVNEQNIARNFRYIFSTGNTIDNFSYAGQVLVAETGKADSTLMVVLHQNLSDTAVIKLSPRYYARINGKGAFRFDNLKGGEYAVYVVPNDGFRKYVDSTRLFAFRNTTLIVNNNTPIDTLYAFAAAVKKETTAAVKAQDTRIEQRFRYQNKLEGGQQDLLSPLVLEFNRKLSAVDTTKFLLTDTNYRILPAYTVNVDTSKKKVSIGFNWKEATPLRLLIQKEAVADSAGTTLSKTDTIAFYTKRTSDYGSIRFRFTNLDTAKHPVLQIVQSGVVIESFVLSQPDLIRKLYKPGTYDLRILYDANGNGKWDTGSFRPTKRQPEIVRDIPRQLTIRANWDNEVTIAL